MSEINRLTARAHDVGGAVTFWNNWYMAFVALTVVLAVGVFITQLVASRRSTELSNIQAAIISEKERIDTADSKAKDEKIAAALKQAGDSNRAAGDANEKAGKAQLASAKSQDNLAEANARAAEANAKAENFRLDIAHANESAEKARSEVAAATAEAAKANLELARLKAPRFLSDAQQSRIAKVLRQFPGQKYSLSVDTDPEAVEFMGAVDALLAKSGWVRGPSQLGDVQVNNAGTGSFSGVFLDVSPDEIVEVRGTIHAVATAFTAEGIPTTPRVNPQLKGKAAKTINVGVGKKQ